MDITELILFQHHEQRRLFAVLEELDPKDVDALGAVWRRLAIFLEIHAEAEERFFYPRLLEIGHGLDDEGPEDETEDAIKDHNEIRDGIAEADQHPVGSEAWWHGVRRANEENSDHMAEEEREDLADFRQHADLQTRHDIAVQFIVFEAQHAARGARFPDKDPEDYVEEHEQS